MKNSVLEQHRKRILRKRSLLILSVLVLLCAFCVRIGFLLNTETVGGTDENRKVTESNLINIQIAASGFADIQLNRKLYESTPPGGPSGYENYTSVTAVGHYPESLFRGTLLEKPHNSELFELLKR